MAAAFAFFIFLQALLYATCYSEPCVGEWSTGTTKYTALNLKQDSYIHVRCRYRHLKVDGEETIRCVGGQLPTYLPQCILRKSSCNALKAPVLGSMKCSSSAPEVGSNCTFECQSTHYLRGTKTRICTADLRWTGSAARCFMKTECSIPPPLHQGTVTGCSPQRKPMYNDICHFRCNQGFRLVGPSQVTCRLDGRLTDEKGQETFPRCEPSGPVSPTSWMSCLVQNGLCSHHCHQEPTGVRCSCRDGYRLSDDDRTCVVEMDRVYPERNFGANPSPEPINPPHWLNCEVHRGYCSHRCHQEARGIRCSCNNGYQLSRDGRTCNDVDECQNDSLNKCDHMCRNTFGSYACLCRPGYASPDGFRCEEMFPSVVEFRSTPLPTPRVSCSKNNGYCAHHCHQEAMSVRCSCKKGYRLASNGRSCIDTLPSVVTSGGEAFSNPASRFSCYFHNGYCSHHCHQEEKAVVCSCRSGYRLAQDGRSCFDVDECLNDRLHKCDHVCRNTAGSYKCLCREGYTSPDGFKCEDVDECSDDRLNKCDQTCKNTDGGYICSCRAGFVSSDGFKCEGCRVNSYRALSDVSCKECPANSYTDGGEKTSIRDCVCNPGFTGNPGQGIPCEDVDECDDGKNFGCSHSCINTPGGAHCACPLGYQLKEDGKTCADIDECSLKNGGCDGICHNTLGNFTCSCPEGYLPSPEDRYSCDDVDECAQENGGCSGECVNFKGGFHCFCAEGHHLHPDGKSCIPVHCPRVFVPHHSTLRCRNSTSSKDKDIYRPEEMAQDKEFPVGATCRIKCGKGYDFRDSHPAIVCQNDGKWNASLPECRVMQCPPLSPPSNGDVYPPSCKNGSSTVKQKCFFTCDPEYRITGQEMLTCRNNLTWSKKKPTHCVPETEASISCPDDDITIELKPDEGWAEMRLNSPRTNLAAGPIRVSPEWVRLDRTSVFPAGETEVTFSVSSRNRTAECSISVIVLDTHPPVFPDCPDTLFVTSGLAGSMVDWEEPVPRDNVGIASVSKSLEPNSTLSPGLHFVEYVARDFAGNVGQCIFHINVTATGGCRDLMDPEHGEANCQEWMFGKICQPTCFDNYTRPPELYACDESGTWTPSDFISPCLLE